jgi:hypothetical protein
VLTPTPNTRRRNALTAAALFLTMLTFVPYVGEQRIVWMMWRDAPLLAVGLIAVVAVLVTAIRRTSNDRRARGAVR